MKSGLLLILIFISHLSFANTEVATAPTAAPTLQEGFNAERWKQLMQLIDGEIKTIRSNPYSGPELKHRLFELYSEKIKLIKEKENLDLLQAASNNKLEKGKNDFFKFSNDQYKLAQRYALSIIKQYPKYKDIDQIYYAMAINSRDYGTSEDTEKYLKFSISTGKKDSKTMYNAKTALAEYYYNNKRYGQAIAYYNDILKQQDNEWYGKHLYNAAWCHLKERNFQKGLELIKESFETTKNPKYVSMKEQIFMAIGIFFVQADATYEGISFLEKNGDVPSTLLLSLANSSMSKNNFSMTEDVLNAALRDTYKRKNANDQMKVRLTQLDIYRTNKRDQLFFDTSRSILDLYKKNKLEEDDIFQAQNKIKEVAGFMQINLIKDKTKIPVTYSNDEYNKIMRYFDILSTMDKKNKNLYRYYQGETALSTHQYHEALKFYVRSIMNAKKMKEAGDITKKTMEAMLSTLELVKLDTKRMNQYTIFTFKNYLLFYPQSEKSQVIYQKLFNKYFEQNNLKKAINTLLVYKHNYEADIAIHREMLTQVLDTYIKSKNTNKLAFWIGHIEKGYLKFTSEYIQNSIAILGSLLFEKYQALEKKGQFRLAIRGYNSIYDSKKYPNTTKAQAAYAIGALSLELNRANDSKKWLNRSLALYDDVELLKITPSLLSLAKGHRLLQKFDNSSEIAEKVLGKFCQQDFKNKNDFYQLSIENAAITGKDFKAVASTEARFNKCMGNDRLVMKTQQETLEKFIYADRYSDIISYYETAQKNPLLSPMVTAYLQYKYYQSPVEVKKDLKRLSATINLEAMVAQNEFVKEFVQSILERKFVFTEKENFDEDLFNSELEQYFSIISTMNQDAIKISKNSNPEEVLMIRNALSKPYFSLVNSIRKFAPKGVNPEYLEGFRQGMRQITESLVSKASQIDREKALFLDKNNYFFETQKSDIFGLAKKESQGKLLDEMLKSHTAILFSNTLDVDKSVQTRVVAGKADEKTIGQ